MPIRRRNSHEIHRDKREAGSSSNRFAAGPSPNAIALVLPLSRYRHHVLEWYGERSSWGGALHKFDPVAERVRGVDPLPACEQLILYDLVLCRAQAGHQLLQPGDDEGWVRLAGRSEVFLHTKMDLDLSGLEPRPATGSKVCWLGDLRNAERPA
jgi:hypothetical protein